MTIEEKIIELEKRIDFLSTKLADTIALVDRLAYQFQRAIGMEPTPLETTLSDGR